MPSHAVQIQPTAPYQLFVQPQQQRPCDGTSSPPIVPRRPCATCSALALPVLLGAALLVSLAAAAEHRLSSSVVLKKQPAPIDTTPTPIHDKAHVVIIRHGEKPEHGDGLSEVGQMRAKYLARCMSQASPTVALPYGPPSHVMASKGRVDKSRRPIETMEPLAKALGLRLDSGVYFKETKGFAQHIQAVLQPGMTLVAAWHHGEIADLVKELLGQEQWRLGDLAWPSKWPKKCGSGVYQEPKMHGGECYDLVWRVTLIRQQLPNATAAAAPRDARGADEADKEEKTDEDDTLDRKLDRIKRFGWRAVSLTASLQGFHGNDQDPCREGLTPVASITA